MSGTTLAIVAIIGTFAYFLFSRRQQPQKPYPPGPPPKPIIGNLLDFPVRQPWIHYTNMAKQYNSDIIHLSSGRMHVVVLTSLEASRELLERRSDIYSSRPFNDVMKMLGVDKFAPFLLYGDIWRKTRKLLKEGLKKDVISTYHHMQMERVHLLLELLLDKPDGFLEHFKMLGASVTMSTLFAYDVDLRQTNRDEYLAAAEFGTRTAASLLKPGGTIISLMPFLRYIPPWFPGASTQKMGAECREATMLYKNGPLEYVKRNMAAGRSRHCITEQLLSERVNSDGTYEDEEVIKDALAGLYMAGVATMQRSLNIFILSMILHPDKQKKAQEEIDRVIGPGRLPTFKDRPSLPYVEAAIREARRWRTTAPLSVPRATTEDDVYKGYFIPKNTVVFSLSWAFAHDENVYPDHETYKPERFFKPDGTLDDDTVRYFFGGGRRICPGEYLADDLLWVASASVLAMFDMRRAKDENGQEIPIDPNVSDDFGNPMPYKCSCTPRSHQSEVLIRNAASTARENLQPAVNA